MATVLVDLRTALHSPEELKFLSNDNTVSDLAQATHILLSPNTKYEKTALTSFLSDPSNSSDVYDLQSLVFAFQTDGVNPGEYMKMCGSSGIKPVRLTDRRAIVDWLASRVENPSYAPFLESSPVISVQENKDGQEKTKDEPVAKRARYVVNKADAELVKTLQSVIAGPVLPGDAKTELSGWTIFNTESVLRGDRPGNFESTRTLVADRIKWCRDNLGKTVTPASQPLKRNKKKPHPIIIISPSPTALVTMWNVKQFLEHSTFVPSNTARSNAMAEGVTAVEDMVMIDHTKTNTANVNVPNAIESKMRFYVVDGVEALARLGGIDDAWDRVVCVMTTGQEWQFRPYKWKEPKQLFHHVKGVYIRSTTDAPNLKVKGWNVTNLNIDPTKRHTDKSTVANFWADLESWMLANRPELML